MLPVFAFRTLGTARKSRFAGNNKAPTDRTNCLLGEAFAAARMGFPRATRGFSRLSIQHSLSDARCRFWFINSASQISTARVVVGQRTRPRGLEDREHGRRVLTKNTPLSFESKFPWPPGLRSFKHTHFQRVTPIEHRGDDSTTQSPALQAGNRRYFAAWGLTPIVSLGTGVHR